jgi:hypothetical protein
MICSALLIPGCVLSEKRVPEEAAYQDDCSGYQHTVSDIPSPHERGPWFLCWPCTGGLDKPLMRGLFASSASLHPALCEPLLRLALLEDAGRSRSLPRLTEWWIGKHLRRPQLTAKHIAQPRLEIIVSNTMSDHVAKPRLGISIGPRRGHEPSGDHGPLRGRRLVRASVWGHHQG